MRDMSVTVLHAKEEPRGFLSEATKAPKPREAGSNRRFNFFAESNKLLFLPLAVLLGIAATTCAQNPGLRDRSVPGVVPVGIAPATSPGMVFQPVQIRAPEGTRIAFARGTDFVESTPAPKSLGLGVGSVYRFRIENIPYYEGAEVYPSLEIVDRTFPPENRKAQFPVIVDITQEDLELALSGKFVTRVVYLENPFTALPVREAAGTLSQDVGVGADPMSIAQTLGRPVAIVRIGGRLPDFRKPDPAYFFGSPPWVGETPGESILQVSGQNQKRQ